MKDIIYLDFSKVFDTVPHDVFIRKMEKCRLDEITVSWYNNWLNKCNQRAITNKLMSEYQGATCGVSQGSVLHLVLINMFTNDLDARIDLSH